MEDAAVAELVQKIPEQSVRWLLQVCVRCRSGDWVEGGRESRCPSNDPGLLPSSASDRMACGVDPTRAGTRVAVTLPTRVGWATSCHHRNIAEPLKAFC